MHIMHSNFNCWCYITSVVRKFEIIYDYFMINIDKNILYELYVLLFQISWLSEIITEIERLAKDIFQ